jgi:hypothetical protein
LKITLKKSQDVDKTGFCNSCADAMIQRIPVLDTNPVVDQIDPNRPVHTLLNILTAPQNSFLKRLGMLLSRLDNLSHILVWSASKISAINSAADIDLIELPRVKISFCSKRTEGIDGKVEHRIYSKDHDGLFVSTSVEARDLVERLLGNIAHFIVLQNAENDLFVLVPGCALPRRLHVDGSHLSVQIILDRRNQEWINNMGEVRCYLYPVHNSRCFLITPSLASSMYLMVLYFITGSYREVFKMVESCVSEELSPEEHQIFSQLEFLGNDHHPDAHACRLKLSAVTVGLGESAMNCPWSVHDEMVQYVNKQQFVSAACRLSPDEELLLLKLCQPANGARLSLKLLNRKAYVTAVTTLATLPPNKSVTVKLGSEKPPQYHDFDGEADDTILKDHKKIYSVRKYLVLHILDRTLKMLVSEG